MSDPDIPRTASADAAPPEPPADTAAAAHDTGPPQSRRLLLFAAVLVALALTVALTVATGWLWLRQKELAARLDQSPADLASRIAAVRQEVDAMAQQIAALQRRVDAGAPASIDLGPLEARIAALEQRQPPSAAASRPADFAPLAQKLDSVAAAAAAATSAEAATAGRLAELSRRLDAAERRADELAGRAARAIVLARAQVALDSGQPLGDIPDAPPALARFAHDRPPTEAQLRLAFPAAAAAAEQASRPATAGKSFGERMWLRAQSLVTVKQGERVVVGPPAAAVLAQAEARLDAGDLAGAVAALDGLDDEAARVIAPWRSQAQALLDARAALAQLARG